VVGDLMAFCPSGGISRPIRDTLTVKSAQTKMQTEFIYYVIYVIIIVNSAFVLIFLEDGCSP